MQFINRVEIQGVVGTVNRHPMTTGGPCALRFSVCTDYVFQSKDGAVVIDTTWHSITAAESSANELGWLQKGTKVRVIGRMRNVRYTDAQGNERSIVEIVAESINEVKE